MAYVVEVDLHFHDGSTRRKGSGNTLGLAIAKAMNDADDEYRSATVRSVTQDGVRHSLKEAIDALGVVDIADAQATVAAVVRLRSAQKVLAEADTHLRTYR